MGFVYIVHAIFGERILPFLIVAAAIWFTVTWNPNTARTLPARLFPILVDIQATLGLILWLSRIVSPGGSYYLALPFIMHPLLGILAAVVAHLAVRPRGTMRKLGRWAPLASLAVLLLLVLSGIIVASAS